MNSMPKFSLAYILIQCLGFVGTAFFLLSYQCRKNKNLFRMQLLSYVFYTTHMFLLGATTGGLSYVLNMARSYFLSSGKKALNGKTACAVLCLLQCLVAALTWTGPVTLLPIVANIASTLAGYSHNPRKIRMATIAVNAPMWIAYDAIVGSWAGIADELVTILSAVISIIRFGWKNLDRKE